MIQHVQRPKEVLLLTQVISSLLESKNALVKCNELMSPTLQGFRHADSPTEVKHCMKKTHFIQEKTRYTLGFLKGSTVPLQAVARDLSTKDVTFPVSSLVSR